MLHSFRNRCNCVAPLVPVGPIFPGLLTGYSTPRRSQDRFLSLFLGKPQCGLEKMKGQEPEGEMTTDDLAWKSL